MPELQLSFHGTFALKKEDVLRMLKAATGEQGINDSLITFKFTFLDFYRNRFGFNSSYSSMLKPVITSLGKRIAIFCQASSSVLALT